MRCRPQKRLRPTAASVVPLMRESRPNPQKRISAHDTTITTKGQEIALANCIEMSRRVCSIALVSPTAAPANCR